MLVMPGVPRDWCRDLGYCKGHYMGCELQEEMSDREEEVSRMIRKSHGKMLVFSVGLA